MEQAREGPKNPEVFNQITGTAAFSARPLAGAAAGPWNRLPPSAAGPEVSGGHAIGGVEDPVIGRQALEAAGGGDIGDQPLRRLAHQAAALLEALVGHRLRKALF